MEKRKTNGILAVLFMFFTLLTSNVFAQKMEKVEKYRQELKIKGDVMIN